MDKVVVYTDAAGEFRWKRIAPNNKVVSDSAEGYEDHSYAVEAAERQNPGVPVVEDIDGDE